MPIKLKRFALYWLPLILYCLLIYIQSAHPPPEQIPSAPFIDKMLHFAAYGIMGILFYRAYQTLRIKNNIQLLMVLSAVSASLYGISDEIHQSFVPFRAAEIADIIADIIGAFSGVWLYRLLVVSRERAEGIEFGSGNGESGKKGMRKAEIKIRDRRG
jgi:VanZ family protein